MKRAQSRNIYPGLKINIILKNLMKNSDVCRARVRYASIISPEPLEAID